MRKTYKYRVYLTNGQRRILNQQLEECRWVWKMIRTMLPSILSLPKPRPEAPLSLAPLSLVPPEAPLSLSKGLSKGLPKGRRAGKTALERVRHLLHQRQTLRRLL